MHAVRIAIISLTAALGCAATPAAAQDEAALACTPPALRRMPMSRIPTAQRHAMIACMARRTAAELNAQAPIPMGNGDVLQSVIASGTMVLYNYRLNVNGEEFSAEERRALGERTRANVCQTASMRETIGWGGKFGYQWFDRSGRLLLDIVVELCPSGGAEQKAE